MAISGQGRLCAAYLGGAISLCVAVPAAGQEREERSLEVRVSGTAVHDSNAARSGRAQAAARGLARSEMEFRPSASVSIVLPFDSSVLFSDTQVGYEFHSRNKRLESERIAAARALLRRGAKCWKLQAIGGICAGIAGGGSIRAGGGIDRAKRTGNCDPGPWLSIDTGYQIGKHSILKLRS